TETPTATFTPSLTPTRVVNPDAVVGDNPTLLLVEPSAGAESVNELAAGSAVGAIVITPDGEYLRVRLLNGTGGGWVRTADVILFVDRAAIPVEGGGVLNTGGERGTLRDDLIEPPLVGTENAGSGIPYLPYNFAACGDT